MQPNTSTPLHLQRFRQAKQAELALLRHAAQSDSLPPVLQGTRPSFRQVLQVRQGRPALIAEYKRASPSRGLIQGELSPEDVARQYQQGGASALSILTEEQYFMGDIKHLARAHSTAGGLPILRKDFIFDPLQIRHTASTPAAALLLIVRLSPNVRTLRALREQTESLGMDAVVEVFDAADLALARDSGARIIQVNARDLESFVVNAESCLALAQQHRTPKHDECWIAASGIRQSEDLRRATEAGFDAVLVGTALMEQGKPQAALTALLEQASSESVHHAPPQTTPTQDKASC